MQPGGALFAEPAPLPPDGALDRLVLESGAWTAGALAVAGGFAVLLLLRSGRAKPAGLAGAAALALAVAVALASSFVQTDRERIRSLARALIDAVRASDATAAAPVVHETVRVVVADQPIEDLDKASLLALIQRVRVDELALLENQAHVEAPGAGVSQIQLRARVNSFPSLSWWRLEWRLNDADDWVAVSIEPVLINGRSPGSALADEMRSRSR